MPLCDNQVADARTEFRDLDTPYLATAHMYNNYVKQTTGLAMVTPGYQHNGEDCPNPPLTENPEFGIMDFVFSRKLQ